MKVQLWRMRLPNGNPGVLLSEVDYNKIKSKLEKVTEENAALKKQIAGHSCIFDGRRGYG